MSSTIHTPAASASHETANKKALLDEAVRVVETLRKLGADEASASYGWGVHSDLARREGKVETATSATSKGLTVSVLVNKKYSSHSTSDLRPAALDAFLQRAVEATQYLEPDPEQGQADIALCGRGATPEELDEFDAGWRDFTPEQRAQWAIDLEEAVKAHAPANMISASASVADGMNQSARAMSNGFAEVEEGAWYSLGAEMTLLDDGKRPEAYVYYGARYRSDLPDVQAIAKELADKAQERLNSGPVESGQYPLILLNQAAGRIVGILGGPLSGGALYERRSCLIGKKGEKIGSDLLTLVDNPLIPRGLGSRPFDGDGLRAQKRTVIQNGVLENYYIGVYYGRKLKMDPTSSGASNWVIEAGQQSWQDVAKQFPKAILVNSFLGGNSNATTGDFSFGIRGQLLENGVPVKSLSEMNISGNIMSFFHKLSHVGNDPWMYSSMRSPTLIFDDVAFSGV